MIYAEMTKLSVKKMRRNFYFILGAFSAVFEIQAYATDTLVFSVDIIRHGDRNPVIDLPKSPYLWEGELGALTKTGADQERDLGARVRLKYVEQFQLLPKTYEEGTIYVRSTHFDRTIESAKSFLFGLYPSEFRKPNSDIIIESVSGDKDDLLLVRPAPDVLSQEKLVSLEKSFWNSMMTKYRDKVKQWQGATGVPLEKCSHAISLADHLSIRKLKGVPFPVGLSQEDIREVQEFGDSCMKAMFHQKEVTEPTGRRILSAVKKYFDRATEGHSKLKYVLFSAHDSTIMTVLNTLGASFDGAPEYASRLNFSLFRNEGELRVKISLNERSVDSNLCPKGTCSPRELFHVSKIRLTAP